MDDLEDLSRRTAHAQNGLDPTRARPEPWFVGSGTWLTAGVISIVLLLIVLRLVTSAWMAEEAWQWWWNQPARYRPAPLLGLPPPLATAPSAAGSKAASAKGDERMWITADDYPVSALRADEQGRVRIRWRVEADGRVRTCGVVSSSGHPALDAAACGAIVRRAEYTPARNAAGQPFAITKERTVVWQIPRD